MHNIHLSMSLEPSSVDEELPSHDPIILITCTDTIQYTTYKSTLIQAKYFYSLYHSAWSDQLQYTLFIDRSSTIVNILLQLLRYNTINVIDFTNIRHNELYMILYDIKYYQFNDILILQLTNKIDDVTAAHKHINIDLICGICYSDCRVGAYLYWCRDHFYAPVECCRKAQQQVRLCCRCWGRAYISSAK